jgi:hypothetical protein
MGSGVAASQTVHGLSVETSHSSPSKAEVRNIWNYTSIFRTLHDMVLGHRDDFTIIPSTYVNTGHLIHRSNVEISAVTIYRILII